MKSYSMEQKESHNFGQVSTDVEYNKKKGVTMKWHLWHKKDLLKKKSY
jgi:hypothetical protein